MIYFSEFSLRVPLYTLFSLARFFCRTTVLLSSTHTHTPSLPPSLPPRDTVVVFDCPDKHTLCLDCFMEYCEVQLQDRQFEEHRSAGYTLRCPAKCEGSEIKESHHFRIMGPEKVFISAPNFTDFEAGKPLRKKIFSSTSLLEHVIVVFCLVCCIYFPLSPFPLVSMIATRGLELRSLCCRWAESCAPPGGVAWDSFQKTPLLGESSALGRAGDVG